MHIHPNCDDCKADVLLRWEVQYLRTKYPPSKKHVPEILHAAMDNLDLSLEDVWLKMLWKRR